MRNKIRLFVGWFGVLTPVYAAGILTMLFVSGSVEMGFVGRVAIVSFVNFYIGRKLLKSIGVGDKVK